MIRWASRHLETRPDDASHQQRQEVRAGERIEAAKTKRASLSADQKYKRTNSTATSRKIWNGQYRKSPPFIPGLSTILIFFLFFIVFIIRMIREMLT